MRKFWRKQITLNSSVDQTGLVSLNDPDSFRLSKVLVKNFSFPCLVAKCGQLHVCPHLGQMPTSYSESFRLCITLIICNSDFYKLHLQASIFHLRSHTVKQKRVFYLGNAYTSSNILTYALDKMKQLGSDGPLELWRVFWQTTAAYIYFLYIFYNKPWPNHPFFFKFIKGVRSTDSFQKSTGSKSEE